MIDVGYAGVIGADKIVHGEQLYGNWPADNASGDTYGPVNYFAYVPFREIWGWSGIWDNLPAAHAAAITFDLLTMVGLFLLGWTVRGPTAGVVLAYLWAAFPFTSYVLDVELQRRAGGDADRRVAAGCATGRPRGDCSARFAGLDQVRAVRAGAAAVARASGERCRRVGERCRLRGSAYGLAMLVPMLPVLLSGDWHWFWHDSIAYQSGRPAPFSIWGLWGGYHQTLHLPEHIVLGRRSRSGWLAPFWPRGERTVVEVAALGAAIIIGLQMGITYWFYLYIVWFFPLVIDRAGARRTRSARATATAPGGRPTSVQAPLQRFLHSSDRDGAHRLGRASRSARPAATGPRRRPRTAPASASASSRSPARA